MRAEQTVAEMAEEILARQAKVMVARKTAEHFESALESVCCTEAGQQRRKLAHGEHRHEKAQDWQESYFEERAKVRLMHLVGSDTLSHFASERHYSWVENYIEWLEDKEARAEYHAFLEEELASLRG